MSFSFDATGTRLTLLASMLVSVFPVSAQSVSDSGSLPPVVVSANRFEALESAISSATTVITAEQIRTSGASSLNEAIRKIAGLVSRQDLNGSSDSAIDLRGFGSTSEQNLVVMVDGVRISEIGLSNAQLSSIPVDSVERVEIVRGGSSVLYGGGATGGTIHVITRNAAGGPLRGGFAAAAGSFGLRDVRASISGGVDAVAVDLSASTLHSDGYRRNGYSDQNNLSLGLQVPIEGGRVGLKTNFARQESGLPGSLTLAQFNADPRQTTKPRDYGTVDSDRYVFFAEKKSGPWDFAADLSRRTQQAIGRYPSMLYTASTDSQTDQFSPRLKHVMQSGDWRHETVAGLDMMRATRTGYSESKQDSDAVYVRHEIRGERASVAVGARREEFDINNSGARQNFGLNAWEGLAAYSLTPAISVYGKAGRSYRVANVDEAAGAVGQLAPQTSNDYEIGSHLVTGEASKLTLNWFRSDLSNEIIFNPDAPTANPLFTGANVNLDPTRREGVELRIKQELTSVLSLQASAQHVSPRFREGVNVGKDIPLVAHNTFAARLTWLPGDGRRADLGWQWVDTQRYGNDFSNSCSSKIPQFDWLDARYAWKQDQWEFALSGNNLTDNRYYSTAYGACRSGIYPDPGRLLQFTVRRDFR